MNKKFIIEQFEEKGYIFEGEDDYILSFSKHLKDNVFLKVDIDLYLEYDDYEVAEQGVFLYITGESRGSIVNSINFKSINLLTSDLHLSEIILKFESLFKELLNVYY